MSLESSSRVGKEVKGALDKAKEQHAVPWGGLTTASPGAQGGRLLLSGLGHREAEACQVWVEKPVTKRSLPSWITSQNQEKSYRDNIGTVGEV